MLAHRLRPVKRRARLAVSFLQKHMTRQSDSSQKSSPRAKSSRPGLAAWIVVLVVIIVVPGIAAFYGRLGEEYAMMIVAAFIVLATLATDAYKRWLSRRRQK
jgi:hypothetical protein